MGNIIKQKKIDKLHFCSIKDDYVNFLRSKYNKSVPNTNDEITNTTSSLSACLPPKMFNDKQFFVSAYKLLNITTPLTKIAELVYN
jgi:hypothetical protein